jgi:hypothetical protein
MLKLIGVYSKPLGGFSRTTHFLVALYSP